MNKVLVTGATGNVGKAVVNYLTDKGFYVKAATRNPGKITASALVEPVAFDFEDSATYAAALSGVDGVFLVAPPMDPQAPAKLNPFIDKAKEMGVGHIVFNSVIGAEADDNAPLRQIELHLMNSGINYTFLRPNFFMENFSSGFLAQMIEQGGIFLAAADGKTSFVSVDDIATVAFSSFSDKLYGKAYTLTGPQALDHAEAAEIITKAMNKPVTYHPLAEEDMLQGARDQGIPEGAVQYMKVLYEAVRNGWAAPVSDDIETVTGKTATSFEQFANLSFKPAS